VDECKPLRVGALATEAFPADDVNTNAPKITLLPAQDDCEADPNCDMAVLVGWCKSIRVLLKTTDFSAETEIL
jgi:hypothetical protein